MDTVTQRGTAIMPPADARQLGLEPDGKGKLYWSQRRGARTANNELRFYDNRGCHWRRGSDGAAGNSCTNAQPSWRIQDWDAHHSSSTWITWGAQHVPDTPAEWAQWSYTEFMKRKKEQARADAWTWRTGGTCRDGKFSGMAGVRLGYGWWHDGRELFLLIWERDWRILFLQEDTEEDIHSSKLMMPNLMHSRNNRHNQNLRAPKDLEIWFNSTSSRVITPPPPPPVKNNPLMICSRGYRTPWMKPLEIQRGSSQAERQRKSYASNFRWVDG